jgi:hypothetical protein
MLDDIQNFKMMNILRIIVSELIQDFFVIGWDCPQGFITWLKIMEISLRVTSYCFSLDVSCSFLPFFYDSLPHRLIGHIIGGEKIRLFFGGCYLSPIMLHKSECGLKKSNK